MGSKAQSHIWMCNGGDLNIQFREIPNHIRENRSPQVTLLWSEIVTTHWIWQKVRKMYSKNWERGWMVEIEYFTSEMSNRENLFPCTRQSLSSNIQSCPIGIFLGPVSLSLKNYVCVLLSGRFWSHLGCLSFKGLYISNSKLWHMNCLFGPSNHIL